MKKFTPEIKEVKYIEIKEQEQQKLVAEQEQQRIEDSYYLENEAWQDISVAKNYGPHRVMLNCSRCPAHYPASSFATRCRVCGGKSTQQLDIERTSSSSSSSPSTQPNNPQQSTTLYNCSRLGCSNAVNARGGYCSQCQP
jgi:hypothetical protein